MGATPSTLTREAGTSPSLRRPLRRRLSATQLLIGAVVALAFSLNLLALQDRNATRMVAVADRPLLAGSLLSLEALRFIPVVEGFEAIDSMLEEPNASDYEGWVLQRSLAEGDLVLPSALAEPAAPTGLRSMSIPVPVEHAAGGTLSPGDRIDVITVLDGSASYVVSGVEILSVSDTDLGSLGGLAEYHIVVAVDGEEALELAIAINSGSLEVIRSTGARVPTSDESGR